MEPYARARACGQKCSSAKWELCCVFRTWLSTVGCDVPSNCNILYLRVRCDAMSVQCEEASLTLGLVVQCLRCLGRDRCRPPSLSYMSSKLYGPYSFEYSEYNTRIPECSSPATEDLKPKQSDSEHRRHQETASMGFVEGCRQRIIIHSIEEKHSMPSDWWLYVLAGAQV